MANVASSEANPFANADELILKFTRNGDKGDTGMIRLDFPGYSGAESLEAIDWDDWFEKFDERNLSLLVQDKTIRGQKSNFNTLVDRIRTLTDYDDKTNARGVLLGAQLLQSDLAEIGIQAEIRVIEWGELIRRAKAGEHDLLFMGWAGDNGDPDNFLTPNLSCAAAAIAMRRILVERARHYKRVKHGGTQKRVELDTDAPALHVDPAAVLGVGNGMGSGIVMTLGADVALGTPLEVRDGLVAVARQHHHRHDDLAETLAHMAAQRGDLRCDFGVELLGRRRFCRGVGVGHFLLRLAVAHETPLSNSGGTMTIPIRHRG